MFHHPSIVPWVHHPLVSNAHLPIIFHASLSCALLSAWIFPRYTIPLYRHAIPFLVVLFLFSLSSPRTPPLLPVCLLSSILQMCPNKFHFLSLILCKMFLLLPILFHLMLGNVYLRKSAPPKATSRRPAYSPALYQIKPAIAKLLVSFCFSAMSKSGKVKPRRQRGRRWGYGCNRWWWRTCSDAGVESR